MSDTKTISQEELTKLFEEFPKLQQFSSQMKTIALLKDDAKEETDPAFIADGFEIVLRAQERLHAEMLSWNSEEHTKQFNGMADNCRGWKANAEKLEAALKEERQANSETFDKMCFLMVVDPRGTFEDVILKNVERQKKIEDTSGQSWQWCLHFSLITRIRMAFKLVFGCKDIATPGNGSVTTL